MCFILVVLLITASIFQANAQPVQFKVPLYLTVGPYYDTLYVGVSGDGRGGTINDNTYGLDETGFGPLGSWGESSAPPADPDGNRKRFVDIPGRTEISAGGYLYPCDFRGFSSLSQVDTFAVRIDGAVVEASGVAISWPNNLNTHGSSWKLYSRAGSVLTEVANMVTTTSYTFATTGSTINFAIIKVGLSATDVKQVDNDIPSAFQLGQNYPNPFNPSTKINYAVKELSRVHIAIYNILGQEVATLVNSKLAAGQYAIDWNGMNSKNEALSSGIYFYRMTVGNFIETKKMILMK
jgi:hypothetical protein